jgi:hypothetical protein
MTLAPGLRTTADHRHPIGETCPYCEQPIPNDRAEEIRARFELKRKQDDAASKAREEQRVVDIRAQLEAANKAQLEKIQQDNAAAVEKIRGDALAQKAAAVEEGKRQAAAEAQLKWDSIAAEHEVAKRKLEESEKLKLTTEKRFEELKAQHDAALAQRTAEVRAAIEKDGIEKINALTAKHAKDTQGLAEQLKSMQRRLDAEEGEGADIKLSDVQRGKFPKDEIKVIKKPAGADILHVVKHNNKECGVIVYDSRNRNAWKGDFATKLREDMVAAKATHAVLTSSKFPGNNRHVCLCQGVIVANPARVAVLAEILRGDIVRNYGQRVSEQNRARKTARLYDFIASERFDNVLDSLAMNDEKLLALDEEEQKVHKKTWERRRLLMTNSQKLHGNLRNQIDGIIGTAETE